MKLFRLFGGISKYTELNKKHTYIKNKKKEKTTGIQFAHTHKIYLIEKLLMNTTYSGFPARSPSMIKKIKV